MANVIAHRLSRWRWVGLAICNEGSIAMSQDSRTDKFVHLYTSCQRQLYVYVRSHVPSAADCDDVIQNVGTVLWEKFDTYRPEESFVRWAFGIARLEVLKFRQKQGRGAVGLRAEMIDLVCKETLEISETADILSEALRKCVEKLSPWSRVVLKQRFEVGKSVREIAKGFNRTEIAVYKTLQGIYDTLYDCVQAEVPRRTSP
jgi:RNA polymerase sigma-70 factor, ECF subfamily